MSNFDTKTMYNFEKYLELQKSGEMNMASPDVRTRLGISKEEHQFLMKNYSSLLQEFNNLKVVNEIIADAKARAEGKSRDDKTMTFSQGEVEKTEE